MRYEVIYNDTKENFEILTEEELRIVLEDHFKDCPEIYSEWLDDIYPEINYNGQIYSGSDICFALDEDAYNEGFEEFIEYEVEQIFYEVSYSTYTAHFYSDKVATLTISKIKEEEYGCTNNSERG